MDSWGIYIHVPFCKKRCPYCAFVLIESDGSTHDRFVDRVCQEIQETKIKPSEVATLYLGGGTPSLLSQGQLFRILDQVACTFGTPTGEITLEVNPEDVSQERLDGYRQLGINRISLGVQSFVDGDLTRFGRNHSAQQAVQAYQRARDRFENVSIDLIFGLPGEDFAQSLTQLLELNPPHVSLYGLTYEPGTEFTQSGRVRLSPESEAALFEQAIDQLTAAGYRHYEISNFAKPAFESRHNLGYWEGRPYLGLGPGAHSYVPYRRWANLSNVRLYLEQGHSVLSEETLTEDQRMIERIFLGLRRDVGVDLLAFQEEFGVALLIRFRPAVAELSSLQLIQVEDGRMRLSRRGMMVADEVVGKFA